MSYSCQLHHLVQKDYDEACEWYESREPGLGERFVKEIRHTINEITLHPETFGSRTKKNLREAKVGFFPYVIVYKVDKRSQVIFVVSIHHTRKNPRKKYRK